MATAFFNIAYILEPLRLVSKTSLGYREDDGRGIYVGKYRSGLSDLQGISPEDIMEIIGVFPTYDDIPEEAKRAARLASKLSLGGA